MMEQTDELTPNQIKQQNYKVQKVRLRKAIASEFYLEAIFIEYVIIEDRTSSIISYEGYKVRTDGNGFASLNSKLNKILEISRNKKGISHRYFDDEYIESIRIWKDKRNKLMHALISNIQSKDEFVSLALEGKEIVDSLCRKSQNYKNAVTRFNKN